MKLLLSILLLLFFFTNCKTSSINNLHIATASNMQFAMKAIIEAFEAETSIKCEMIVSSSGKLTAQIKEGAPYDIFVSADMKFPNRLYKDGFSIAEPQNYAKGKLVLWSMKEEIQPSIAMLISADINHIALANPKTAPYGKAAMETLDFYKLTHQVQEKLVYGESISQTNQFISLEAAEIGFTAKSVVSAPFMKGKGRWIEIPDSVYSPIEQGVILLKNAKKEASLFYEFLFSKKGKAILVDYGYEVEQLRIDPGK